MTNSKKTMTESEARASMAQETERAYAEWKQNRVMEMERGDCAKCPLNEAVCSKVDDAADFVALSLFGPERFAQHVDEVHALRDADKLVKETAKTGLSFAMPAPSTIQ